VEGVAQKGGAQMTDLPSDDLVAKYKHRLAQELELKASLPSSQVFSREYQLFRSEVLPPHMSFYEQVCKTCEKIFAIKAPPGTAMRMQEAIDAAHLQVTPSGVLAASILVPSGFMIVMVALAGLLFNSMFFALFFASIGIGSIVLMQKIPEFMANVWRMKSSNQMVLCIFYVVTYMRHTSNLELAIEFASDHLAPPLSLDLRKVLWDVESGKFETVKDSLEAYLEGWKQYNLEFVESFHLIQSSLFETSEERRLGLLDKSLDVMLDETYEKMLHYAQNLKSPITALHMLGVILPILGLVILPLAVSFMEGIAWYHIAAIYNVALPLFVYFVGKKVLSNRPTGYGDTDVSESNPQLKKYRNVILNVGSSQLVIPPALIAVVIGVVFFFIGVSPVIIHALAPDYDMTVGKFSLLDYKNSSKQQDVLIGPFGLGASLLSLFIPLALAFSFGLYYKMRSSNVIKIRDDAKKLEDEFASALFQLGNRLGDGFPAEIAFPKVAELMEDTISGKFFKLVSINISKLGMSVQDALFNSRLGAVVMYPSAIIQSSMKVLIESVKKGPVIAAQGLLNVARYIKEIHKVNERLKDLMSEIISDMKSQISFLTPLIAGIVIGITSMITYILGNLTKQISSIGAEGSVGQSLGGIGGLANFFGDSIPTFYFQAVVGLYVVEICFILTVLSSGIENGADKLQERYLLGNNLIKSTLLYVAIAAGVMLLFNIVGSQIIDLSKIST